MQKKVTEIELLAPAKNLEFGIEAINCGADAVYIGAEKFGARYAAGNSVEAITELVNYAHQFGARVYVTLNTILFEEELQEAKELALELCKAGVDALIVQDMAYLMFDLPIQLHASTQTASHTLERIKFLESVGFDRIVIERALSGNEIAAICKKTKAEIEAFVHGAICVSYSGACYMGHILSKRSGNRGYCSQPCRSSYNLYDEDGNILANDKHFLSVKDFMLSQHIADMIESGVKSFKIEGRLKDLSYLKNSVLHYRKQIDNYLAENNEFKASSDGEVNCDIVINLYKSFTRGFSDYYYNGKQLNVSNLHTAKSIGEYMGEVIDVGEDNFILDRDTTFNNGDGICFLDRKGELTGSNINTSHERMVYPNQMENIRKGTKIYRNYDIKYTTLLEKKRIGRKINININTTFEGNKLVVTATELNGLSCYTSTEIKKLEQPNDINKMQQTIVEQLKKSGDTIFKVLEVTVDGEIAFIPISVLNSLRRNVLEKLKKTRLNDFKKLAITKRKKISRKGDLDYKANVTNSLSEQFYRECGYKNIEQGVELRTDNLEGLEAMTMKYCIRRELNECVKTVGNNGKLVLENGGNYFEIVPDCDKCEMTLIYRGRNYSNKK